MRDYINQQAKSKFSFSLTYIGKLYIN